MNSRNSYKIYNHEKSHGGAAFFAIMKDFIYVDERKAIYTKFLKKEYDIYCVEELEKTEFLENMHGRILNLGETLWLSSTMCPRCIPTISLV